MRQGMGKKVSIKLAVIPPLGTPFFQHVVVFTKPEAPQILLFRNCY